jgi:hypothetical protein
MNRIKWWIIKLGDKWKNEFDHDNYDSCHEVQLTSNRLNRASRPKRSNQVETNYDEHGTISFKVYSANGGKIVEAKRYEDKYDNERIKLYIIEENADFAESLSRIVTMEYLQ